MSKVKCILIVLLIVLMGGLASCQKTIDKQVDAGTQAVDDVIKGEAQSMRNAASEAGKETYNEVKSAAKVSADDIKSKTDEVINEATEATRDAGERVKGAFQDGRKLFGK